MTQSRLIRLIKAQAHRKALRDLGNRIRFGADAPLSDELIWIDPAQVTHGYQRRDGARWRRRHSGLVVGGDWDLSRNPIETNRKYRSCLRHFVDGQSWEETGILDEMMREIERHGVYDGCRSYEDLVQRYDGIDRLYDEIARTRRLEPVSERPERLRREHGGIFVHITRDGTPLLAGNGNHRMAISRILKLDRIPAQIGAVHRQAVDRGLLAGLRRP